MSVLRIRLDAPFAAFRSYTAGSFRPTATFLTPSAAYGLLLNVAGIESRLREESHNGTEPTTYMRSDLPTMELAIGMATIGENALRPHVQTVFQQLHNYPVGASGKERKPDAHGNKYNIAPVRREFLSGLRAIIAVKADGDTEKLIRRGLDGTLDVPRYGLPFLGDNNFLPDRLESTELSSPVFWYERLTVESGPARPYSTRMTIWIDRADMSRTISALFAPGVAPAPEPSPSAWVRVGPPQESS